MRASGASLLVRSFAASCTRRGAQVTSTDCVVALLDRGADRRPDAP
jgi:hypothetical protein